MMLIRVEAPHFIAGIEIDNHGKCVNAAPILKWCLGNGVEFLRDYFQRKGWKANITMESEKWLLK